MTHAEKLYGVLEAERAAGPINRSRWLLLVQQAFDEALAAAPAPRPKSTRTRLDELFDALCAIQGSNAAQMTRSMKGAILEVRKQIMEASPDVTGEEIKRRAALYRRKHPTWPLTATSLCKWWSEFGPADKTQLAKDDLYQEPDGDWRTAALGAIGVSQLPEDWKGWADVPYSWREAIKKATNNQNGACNAPRNPYTES